MLYSTNDAKLHTFFIASIANKECTFIVIAPRTTQSVTHLIAKCCYATKLSCISLHRKCFCWQDRCRSRPSLTIKHYIRVYSLRCLAYEIHCLYIMYAHKVETESIDMVFLHPIGNALYHILAELFTL